MKKNAKPFGIEFLSALSADELQHVNGGRHKKHHHGGGTTTPPSKPPIYHTMMASFPGPNGTVIGDQ
jgi:hypothetical protein